MRVLEGFGVELIGFLFNTLTFEEDGLHLIQLSYQKNVFILM